MSIIYQYYYAEKMKAQGYKFAYYLQEYDEDKNTWGEIVHGPFDASEGAVEKLMKLDPDRKLYMGCCWIDDEGDIVG